MHKKFVGTLILITIPFYIVYRLFLSVPIMIWNKLIVITIVLLIAFIIYKFVEKFGYDIYTEIYFRSKKFVTIKESISEHTINCNDLNHYIEELKKSYVRVASYNYGTSQVIDNSIFNFQRKEWNKITYNNQTFQCSASICTNARRQPIKYLCKYFNIKINEESLSKFESILNDYISVEQGKNLLLKERESIVNSISKSIPFLIQKFSKEKLTAKLGFETIDISDTYIPTFTFQYVSAGGNSSSNCVIPLNIENLNQLINYLNDIIEQTKSIAGQRALMTSNLREIIKQRDNYQCCACNIGIKHEPNLLLEIDHIIPLSKGGITTLDNLQTLCWKCNRTKGAKII